jgi:alpha-glucosidase
MNSAEPVLPPAPRPPLPVDDHAWWHGGVGYQVYPRSFADSTGDGQGDLWGIVEHVDHIADLGVDFVWINPVYPSPGLDHGYDVADYLDIDGPMGGMPAFEALRDALHDRGIRLLMDIVPGHTSDRHPWFQSALQGPDSPDRDVYVWRDPAPDGGPPNNWISLFGGSAWAWDEASGQYWMHRFLPEQPDLNWRNPEVADRMEDVLRFWFERGVDGFRVDVAQGMLADPTWADRPQPPAGLDRQAARDWMIAAFMGQPDTPALWERWRRVADEYDAMLLGEVYLEDPFEVATYATDERLHRAFYLPLQHLGWDREVLAARLRVAVEAGRGRFAWPQSSHDDPRAGTRFGGGALGSRRALAFFHLVAALPGTPVMLAGDELGLDNGQVPDTHAADPVTVRNDDRDDGRDGSRTPMPWDHDEPNWGFTTGTPWLPIGENRTADQSVAAQAADPKSPLHRMRALLASRKDLTAMLGTNEVEWLDLDDQVIALRRGDVVTVCNLGPQVAVDLPGRGAIVAASSDDAVLVDTTLTLGTDTTALVAMAS